MENGKKVSPQVAMQEVERWLDLKRIKASKRESNADTIEGLAESFEDGTLTLDDKGSITMNLTFGIGENESIKQLKFKPRISVGEIHQSLKGIKGTDADARIIAYMAALTGQMPAVIRKLDTTDHGIASGIVVFFF